MQSHGLGEENLPQRKSDKNLNSTSGNSIHATYSLHIFQSAVFGLSLRHETIKNKAKQAFFCCNFAGFLPVFVLLLRQNNP